MYSKNKVAEGNPLGTPNLNSTPHLKLEEGGGKHHLTRRGQYLSPGSKSYSTSSPRRSGMGGLRLLLH